MGLDITGYSHLEPLPEHERTDSCWEVYNDPGEHVQAFAYYCFPQSYRGLRVLGTRELSGGGSFIEGGCYAVTDKTERISFRAGSYSGYNVWRRDLAEQFNPYRDRDTGLDGSPCDPDLPFFELVWFADNEGTIGPEAARDLLADFREHREAYVALHSGVSAETYPGRNRYDVELYDQWTRAMELAADGGLVSFH